MHVRAYVRARVRTAPHSENRPACPAPSEGLPRRAGARRWPPAGKWAGRFRLVSGRRRGLRASGGAGRYYCPSRPVGHTGSGGRQAEVLRAAPRAWVLASTHARPLLRALQEITEGPSMRAAKRRGRST